MKEMDVEIIKLLLENRERELSIADIAKLSKKDYKTIHNVVSRLISSNIVKIVSFGRSNKVILSNSFNPLIFEAEFKRRESLLKQKNFSALFSYFEKLSSNLYCFLVFGSYAKNTQTKQSDIDLMFVVPDTSFLKLEREINGISKIIPLDLHINVFSESDFKAMASSKKDTVGSEVIKSNIILYGIENYYRMIM